jgi:hypothetical protein
MMAWITQGPIADRTQEHLGASDKGVALYRLGEHQVPIAVDVWCQTQAKRDEYSARADYHDVKALQEKNSMVGERAHFLNTEAAHREAAGVFQGIADKAKMHADMASPGHNKDALKSLGELHESLAKEHTARADEIKRDEKGRFAPK